MREPSPSTAARAAGMSRAVVDDGGGGSRSVLPLGRCALSRGARGRGSPRQRRGAKRPGAVSRLGPPGAPSGGGGAGGRRGEAHGIASGPGNATQQRAGAGRGGRAGHKAPHDRQPAERAQGPAPERGARRARGPGHPDRGTAPRKGDTRAAPLRGCGGRREPPVCGA